MIELTQERLKKLLHYNLITGDFTWRVFNGGMKQGDLAGTIDKVKKRGYRRIGLYGKIYKAHRLAFLYVLSEFPEQDVDHINGDKFDNRWINLRPVSKVENCKNQALASNNTSGHIGVHWCKRDSKWVATIKVDNILKFIGQFVDKEDAIKVRKAAEKKYGFHENHGRPSRLNGL